jgi:triosephosphate isomerase
MFSTAAAARQLSRDVVNGLGSETHIRAAVCPPAPYLGLVGDVVRGTPVVLGAQNVYPEKEG